jgi:signal transduction histidine kinase
MDADTPATPSVAPQRDAAALGLAYLFGTGGALVLLTLILPHGDDTDALALALICVVAAGVTVATLARAFPLVVYEVLVALGGVLIAGCVYWGGASARAYPLFYVWCALYAFYFFPALAALAVTAFSAASFAVVLIVRDVTPVPWVDFVLVAGTITVAGTLIGRLIREMRNQADDLAEAGALANAMSAAGDAAGARDELAAAARRAVRADAAVLLEPAAGGVAAITARSGDEELAGRLAADPRVAEALLAGEPRTLGTPEGSARPISRGVDGLAHGVHRDGGPAGVLVVGWDRPRRVVTDRATAAVALYVSALPVILEREDRLSGERERRALELNDAVVQGLAAAKYALEVGQTDRGAEAVESTLERARDLMDRQLGLHGDDPVRPGDLRRRPLG